MKKLLLLAMCVVGLANANAEIIEIDTSNVQNCINQLSQAKANFPIILEYMENCPHYHDFLPIFQKSAEDHPNLSYYKVNTETLTSEVKDRCLGIGSAAGSVSPKVTVNFVIPSQAKIIPFRSDVGGLTTAFSADDLNHLIRGLDRINPPAADQPNLPQQTIRP